MRLALQQKDLHGDPEDIHNRWYEELCLERMQCYDNGAKKA